MMFFSDTIDVNLNNGVWYTTDITKSTLYAVSANQ